MTITYIIKKPQTNSYREDEVNMASIYIRLRDGRTLDSTQRTPFVVNPYWWDTKTGGLKNRVVCNDEDKHKLSESLQSLKDFVLRHYLEDKSKNRIIKSWLTQTIKNFFEEGKIESDINQIQKIDEFQFQNRFEEFLNSKEFSETRLRQFRVVERAVLRFEEFYRMTKPRCSKYSFDIRMVDENDLSELYDFMSKEHIYFEKYPELYEKFPEKRQSKPRGANTLSNNFKELRSFFNWCCDREYIQKSPFRNFKFEGELYGTPYYLTREELHSLAETDLSEKPALEIQRDIFVFQCCIGCRVYDLLRLVKSDVIDGAIEYIPTKTIAERASTVRVPLNQTALAILEKYKDLEGNRLLPFISSQKYNDDIKSILTICGITRLVTRLNSLTRKEEKVPINEVASSHMARRTFIANIYNKVQDPNLICSLTGHVEGSKAFCRYRTVEEGIKKELVDILDK